MIYYLLKNYGQIKNTRNINYEYFYLVTKLRSRNRVFCFLQLNYLCWGEHAFNWCVKLMKN